MMFSLFALQYMYSFYVFTLYVHHQYQCAYAGWDGMGWDGVEHLSYERNNLFQKKYSFFSRNR